MSRFVWSPEYELGIEVIDHQHQRIIEYINQIYDARSRAAAQDSLAAILPNLVDTRCRTSPLRRRCWRRWITPSYRSINLPISILRS